MCWMGHFNREIWKIENINQDVFISLTISSAWGDSLSFHSLTPDGIWIESTLSGNHLLASAPSHSELRLFSAECEPCSSAQDRPSRLPRSREEAWLRNLLIPAAGVWSGNVRGHP